MSYCPFVFHHIRLIDNISIDDILASLDPLINIKKIMKVSGGRGNNSLISTWDKKIILKTIDENERQILVDKMIIDFHCMMKEEKSILSRIYGVFKIELRDKGSINVIIQRNMNDLPLSTKILTFDFKGSTVDRQTISKCDVGLNKDELINKYKNKVLKDIDLGIIGMKFELNSDDLQKISNIIDCDSSFLQNLEITDYSLIVFVHKYNSDDIINNIGSSRIFPSKDKKYLFNFTIVDFLGTFNFEKKGEKLAKSLVGYIKKLKDTNFSVLEPYSYAKRFRKFCKRIITDG
jgi:1-phosphatidylinositol-4-phosphate 5-kinase